VADEDDDTERAEVADEDEDSEAELVVI
jgi:hypothetical protein